MKATQIHWKYSENEQEVVENIFKCPYLNFLKLSKVYVCFMIYEKMESTRKKYINIEELAKRGIHALSDSIITNDKRHFNNLIY